MKPKLINLLTMVEHDRQLKIFAKSYIKGRLLDIGCGTKPYRDLLSPFVTEHIGIDHKASLHSKDNVDLEGTAYNIPVPDASFDSVICTSVLEHLEEPEQALRECLRILKSGGFAIYCVPFIWHLHEEPRDFYRFSKYGIDYLFTKVGFDVVELNALCGFWGSFGQMLVYNLFRFNRGPIRWLKIMEVLGLIIQCFSYILDKIDRTEKWTSNYMVVARKP